MNTQTAATKARVTVATIRTWCRRNAVAAVKTGRGWDIDEASLDHRIALGPKASPIAVTDDTWGRSLAVRGPADLLARSFESHLGVTITSGSYAGETVHLGRTSYPGARREGLDHADTDGTAVYLIDTGMLHIGAPTLLDAYEQSLADGALALAEADRAESAYLNPRFV